MNREIQKKPSNLTNPPTPVGLEQEMFEIVARPIACGVNREIQKKTSNPANPPTPVGLEQEMSEIFMRLERMKKVEESRIEKRHPP